MVGSEKNDIQENSRKLEELLRKEIYFDSMQKNVQEFSAEKIQACVTLLENYESIDQEEIDRAQKQFLEEFMEKHGITEKRRKWKNWFRNTTITCLLTMVIACTFGVIVNRTQAE